MASQYATSSIHHLRSGALIHGVSAPRALRWKAARTFALWGLIIVTIAAVAVLAHAPRLQGAATVAMFGLVAVAPGMLVVRRAGDWVGAAVLRFRASQARRRATSHLAAAIRAPHSRIMMYVGRAERLAACARRGIVDRLRTRVRVPHIAAHARTTARSLRLVGATT